MGRKKKTSFKLSPEWMLKEPIDFEYNKYTLLDYLQKCEKRFNNLEIYPDFVELSLHLANIQSLVKENTLLLTNKKFESCDDEILVKELVAKKPRELTWVTGVILASVTVSFGVTGYSLPWDQVGYWACKIVTGVPNAIPVVGDSLVELLRGGTSVGQGTLTRFYSLHTFVLPLITAVLMLAHFLMIRKQGISGPL
jgi:hypothetical protein